MASFKPTRTIMERATAIAAVAANGGNVRRTALELGIPQATLRDWMKREPQLEAEIRGAARVLAEKFDVMADKLLAGVTDEKIQKANVSQLMKAAGTAIDKARVLRGHAVAGVGTTSVTVIEVRVNGQAADRNDRLIEAGPLGREDYDDQTRLQLASGPGAGVVEP